MTGKNEYEINALMKKALIIFKQKIHKTTKTKRSTLCFWYPTKIRFQCWERMLYIQYIYISVPLSLKWRAVTGGRGGCEGCGRMLHPLPHFRTVSDLCEILLENFPNYRSVGQSKFTEQAFVVIFSCLAYEYYESVKGY